MSLAIIILMHTQSRNFLMAYWLSMLFAFASFLDLVNSQYKNIFLLAGQSNMSGQGGVIMNKWDGVVPPECSSNHSILKLNAQMNWEEAMEPLHDDIDVTITNGIGPGMPFANSLLNNYSGCGVIGLVPCAITGTKIIEWQKGTNFYNQLVDRAQTALGDGGIIQALLWYQGESDTVLLSNAIPYKRRFQQFITDLRQDLQLPDLLIIEVALASGANYTEIVRHAQLDTASELANVRCVDAKGLPLEADNLHLSTPAQVSLGGMLANAFLSDRANKLNL